MDENPIWTDKDYFTTSVGDSVALITSFDIPLAAEKAWAKFCRMVNDKKDRDRSEVVNHLDQIRQKHWGAKAHEVTITEEKKQAKKTIKALLAAGEALHDLHGYGSLCYHDAVKKASVNETPSIQADQLIAAAEAMQARLDSAPPDGAKDDRLSSKRAKELRQQFYATVDDTLRKLFFVNPFLDACGESHISIKTFSRDKQPDI